MCLIFRKSPFLQPFHTFHQLNSWLENSNRKRKGSRNVLIKVFSPIFHTYVGGTEDFLIQFISSPEIKICVC